MITSVTLPARGAVPRRCAGVERPAARHRPRDGAGAGRGGGGAPGALGLRRLAGSLLFDVSAADPMTYAGVAALLMGVALLACYVPAQRATKLDPLVALRNEESTGGVD